MILQPLLMVNVLDASVYGPDVIISPRLMWWDPRSQIMPLSAKLRQDLGPKEIIIYVYKDVLSSHLSSGGHPPSNLLAPPTGNNMGLG